MIEDGVPNVVCAQPFACLPNHVTGKGMFGEIRRRHPAANITTVEYDPGASQVNQLNRIRLLVAAARSGRGEADAEAAVRLAGGDRVRVERRWTTVPHVGSRPYPRPVPDQPSRASVGLAAGVAAYALWGVFPLYFPLLEPAGPVEIIAHRVVWSLVVCAAILAVTRSWGAFAALWRQPRTLLLLGIAAVFLAVNWLVYVFAVNSGQTVDASLGYFINPLFTVLLAVVFLGERLRPVQWTALGLGTVAVVVIAAGHGSFPWIALGLAASFGLYGFIKSRVGRHVDVTPGLATETALIAPLAVGYWVWLEVHGTSTFGAYGGWHATALVSAGVVTAVPLLLFATAARHLPLSDVGLIQYLTPVLQFLIGVAVQHEAMSAARWVGFALVWIALVVLVVDGLHHRRTQLLEARAATDAAGA